MRVWGVLVHLACYTVGWVYPAFRSFESLESKSTLDDSQWLTYWVLLAVYSICEAICWRGAHQATVVAFSCHCCPRAPQGTAQPAVHDGFRRCVNRTYVLQAVAAER